MTSGKEGEEVARMSAVLDAFGPEASVLITEPFASTNEREGSQIGRHVFGTLVRRGVTVVEPLSASFGRDLYAQVFSAPTGPAVTKI